MTSEKDPGGAPLKFNLKAPINVKLHFTFNGVITNISVTFNGVITNISVLPTYS